MNNNIVFSPFEALRQLSFAIKCHQKTRQIIIHNYGLLVYMSSLVTYTALFYGCEKACKPCIMIVCTVWWQICPDCSVSKHYASSIMNYELRD